MNLNQLDLFQGKKVINELIDLSKKRVDSKSAYFEQYLNNNFGKTLCDIYFKKYNNSLLSLNL